MDTGTWNSRKKNTPDTEFYIGSSQKALTATAILQLVEKGKLSLTNPVSQYLSGFPSGITIKNLLNHTSGLKGHLETNSKITPKELVQDIEERGVKRAPGKWDYRDSNYTVLAYLVEKLSGQSLADYYKQHIFKPAGMTQVGFYEDFKQQKKCIDRLLSKKKMGVTAFLVCLIYRNFLVSEMSTCRQEICTDLTRHS